MAVLSGAMVGEDGNNDAENVIVVKCPCCKQVQEFSIDAKDKRVHCGTCGNEFRLGTGECEDQISVNAFSPKGGALPVNVVFGRILIGLGGLLALVGLGRIVCWVFSFLEPLFAIGLGLIFFVWIIFTLVSLVGFVALPIAFVVLLFVAMFARGEERKNCLGKAICCPIFMGLIYLNFFLVKMVGEWYMDLVDKML